MDSCKSETSFQLKWVYQSNFWTRVNLHEMVITSGNTKCFSFCSKKLLRVNNLLTLKSWLLISSFFQCSKSTKQQVPQYNLILPSLTQSSFDTIIRWTCMYNFVFQPTHRFFFCRKNYAFVICVWSSFSRFFYRFRRNSFFLIGPKFRKNAPSGVSCC